jgi:adenine-specific DNA-methyltransferase
MHIRSWADSASPTTLPTVPGAAEQELRQLAALGGLAAAVAGDACATWPVALHTWAYRGPAPPKNLLAEFADWLDAGQDPFVEAYNACISASNRRRLGTVFTPSVLVEHMLDMVEAELDTAPATVIDPGAGVGAFTVAAARRWPASRVIAVDVNVVTLGLLAARIEYEKRSARTPLNRSGSIELVHRDFLDALPELLAVGAAGPAVVVGNPPYTRTQALPAEFKQRASAAVGHLVTSGHANLALIFQALAIKHLREGDASCMVLPGSIAYTRAARDLRVALWKSDRPVAIRRWPATTRAFIGRNVQAAVVLVGPASQKGAAAVRLSRAETGDRVTLLEEWELPRLGEPPANWYWHTSAPTGSDTVPLTDVARVRRGLATGANAFFFLTDAGAADVPATALLPAVPSLRRFGGDTMTVKYHSVFGGADQRRWLLALDVESELPDSLRRYIERNEATYSQRHLCQQRAIWWAITERPRPDILLSPLSKTAFKVVINAVHAVPSNNLIGISVKSGDPQVLADWLRGADGQAELLRVSRRYHGGSHKLEPGDLGRVLLPTDVAAALGARVVIARDGASDEPSLADEAVQGSAPSKV